MAAHCPWQELGAGSPSFCEAALCTWIREPGNTWTNVGFLAAAWWMWRRAGRLRMLPLRWLAFAAAFLGAGSAAFHATGLPWAGSADYAGMFLVTGAMTALNVRRWKYLPRAGVSIVAIGTSVVLYLLCLIWPGNHRLFYVLASPCVVIELGLWFRDRAATRYSDLFLAAATTAVGTLCWLFDVNGRICNPRNHVLSLHGVWHLTMAASIALLFRFYEQFPSLKDRA